MDPVTHLTAGALFAQAVRRKLPTARGLWPFCLILAVLPDADILFFRSDPTFYLLHHRGFTHSLAFVAVAAPLLAWLYRRPAGRPAFGMLTVLAAGLLLTHIYQDLATSYGTQVLAPFTNRRFGFDALFIIDPVYTGAMLLAVFLGAFWKRRRTGIAFLALAWLFLYPLASLGVRIQTERGFERQLTRLNVEYDSFIVTTDALSPLFWKTILIRDNAYALENIDLRAPVATQPKFTYLRPSAELLATLRAADPFLDTYFWFTAYPYYMEEKSQPDERTLVFGDLRFSSAGPVMRSLFENGRTPFALSLTLKSDGSVKSFIFHRGGRTFARTLIE